MYKTLVISITIFLISCSGKKESKLQEQNIKPVPLQAPPKGEQQKIEEEIALLKDLTFCKCMIKATQTFNVFDSSELYSSGTSIQLEEHDIQPFRIRNTLDSIIYKEVIRDQIIKKQDMSRQVAEGVLGKTTYLESCLEFSRSKKLDSLLRKIPRAKYYRPF